MVVHEDDDRPLEMATDKRTNDGTKTYVILNNHVREVQLPTTHEKKESTANSSSDKDTESPKSKKSKKLRNITSESSQPKRTYAQLVSNQLPKDTTMSSEDLEELRSVYYKCKSVLRKFETKYGHLLDLDAESEEHSNTRSECHCNANKKIIFDDNGEQTVKQTPLENHICANKNKKVKRKYSDLFKSDVEILNLQVEYEPSILPDDLVTLQNMLQDPELQVKQRNEIINKIRAIKVERINEIRFNRPSLREKLRVQPNEVLEFKGANLFKLPGYPDGK